MSKIDNMGTYTLSPTGGPAANGVYVISAADGVYVIAMQLQLGGSATYKGKAKIGNFGSSTTLDLVVGETTILQNPDPIDDFTITVTSGTVKVITNQ